MELVRVYRVFSSRSDFVTSDARDVVEELMKLDEDKNDVLTVNCTTMDKDEYEALEEFDDAKRPCE